MMVYGLLLVIASAFTHALWNLFAKRSLHKESFLFSLHAVATVLFLPFFIRDLITMTWTWGHALLLIVSFLLQGTYLYLVSQAYKAGELSQVYPMMRGTAALLVPLVSVSLYGESMSAIGWLGWSLIVGGLFGLSGMLSVKQKDKSWWIALALTTSVGMCTAAYTLTDKAVIEFFSPLGLIEISNIGAVIFLAPAVKRAGLLRREWQANWSTIGLGAVISPGSYLLFLFAMTLGPLAHLAPIREFSIVIGTLLGYWILKEKQGKKRLVASTVVAAGMALISMWG
ncbi:EamA family transporter [Paenibacillus thiaminolyticus]|uniref:EamA family transporter n=1 Tax=Paenibacillus thiaminolyticus TaxID=49283 RepID=UPI00116404BF|nr:EamA family transporter [Paenibacillus thiaminolyticus]NGP58367.1 EamA family transporter [Paenibacillus thiaminolyticus]WCR26581.1 EamA family transporter [Paenibacillus thiaminolyticus]